MEKLETCSRRAADPPLSSYCGRLSQDIGEYVAAHVNRIAAKYFPDWRIPGTFLGHQVGSEVHADVAFTLGLLHQFGVARVAGSDVAGAIGTVLRSIDGKRTNTFWSYRVAETLRLCGTFAHNHLMEGWSPGERDNLAAACDSTESIAQLEDGRLPRNYAAVLARCEWARARLGLIPDDAPLLATLAGRTKDLMAANPEGYLDDSDCGCGRYDIYTADLYLFSEPFAHLLGPIWERGVRNVVRLVEKTVTRSGVAFPWGRSTGALAACMTMELGALTLRNGLAGDPGRWLTLVRCAFESLPGWFSGDGLISAHQRRSTYRYRGLHRLLQMTFDCLGKLMWTALSLRQAAAGNSAQPIGREAAFPDQDEFVSFDAARKAGVWCYRSRSLSFVLPVTGSTLNDYLPSPHNPGLFEVPVEMEFPSGVPFAFVGDMRFVAGYLPVEIEKFPGGIRLQYDGYPKAGQWNVGRDTPGLAGRRTVTYRVEGRTIIVEEDLRFGGRPSALGIQITETLRRPLAVQFECPSPHSSTVIETDGMKDFRSFWAELPRAHQMDIQPAEEVRFHYRVTPLLRVLSANHRHHYHRVIYDRLAGQVADGTTMPSSHDARSLPSSYKHWDIFHLHWPEAFGADLDHHREIIADLAAAGVPVVWTQHNLVPHTKDERFPPIYERWAAAARGVIHHSRWGKEQVLQRYPFRSDAIHRVIPHPHFGDGATRLPTNGGVTSGRLRLGIFGAPRAEKRVDMAVRAFTRCGRNDLELSIFSLSASDPVPQDPRIVAHRYEFVPRAIYDARMSSVDLLILPYDSTGMLTTGIVGDVVAHGVPALISDWPYLSETLGDAAIRYGHTEDHLVEALDLLDVSAVTRARQACSGLQERYSPQRIANLTLDLLEAVATA
jgi:glycosyltransferase involved in cell wall biosynthesis